MSHCIFFNVTAEHFFRGRNAGSKTCEFVTREEYLVTAIPMPQINVIKKDLKHNKKNKGKRKQTKTKTKTKTKQNKAVKVSNKKVF